MKVFLSKYCITCFILEAVLFVESVAVPPVHEIHFVLAEPGAIRKEYENEIKKFEEQLKLERQQEETASNALILKLQVINLDWLNTYETSG